MIISMPMNQSILNIKLNNMDNTYSSNISKNNIFSINSNINQNENTNNNIISTSTINNNYDNINNSKGNTKNNISKINNNTNEKINTNELLSNKIKQKDEKNNKLINNINFHNDMGISQNNLKGSKISQVSHNIGEETINFSLSEDESGLSGYFKFRTSQQEDKDKEYNYNDVLPIINKVSKLKEIKETEEDQKEDKNDYNSNHSRKQSASDIVNNVLNAISDSKIIRDENEENNEDEKYKMILNKFKQEDKENDILYNQVNINDLNNSKDSKDIVSEKPKMIRKNSADKEKRQNLKMITFEEFLTKENEGE